MDRSSGRLPSVIAYNPRGRIRTLASAPRRRRNEPPASPSAGRLRPAEVRRTVYRILDPDARDTPLERAGNLVLASLIVLNVAAVILETVPSLRASFRGTFLAIEAVSVATFTVEYLLRVLTCTVDPRYAGGLRGRLRFVLTPMALIDLAAVLPSYLASWIALDLRYLRVVRLVRLLRVLKLARYSRTMQTFGNVLRHKREELGVIVAFLMMMMVLSSCTMYFVEHDAQPEAFSSIPASMWWTMVTLTTVGYGDIYPVTPLGRILGSVIALAGIGFFALPAGLLAGAFAEEVQKRRRKADRPCPHCGKPVE